MRETHPCFSPRADPTQVLQGISTPGEAGTLQTYDRFPLVCYLHLDGCAVLDWPDAGLSDHVVIWPASMKADPLSAMDFERIAQRTLALQCDSCT